MLICFRGTSESIECFKKNYIEQGFKYQHVSQVWQFSFLLKIDSRHKTSVLK